MSSQLCTRCGRHEYSGSFCSYCRTADYDLVDHEDTGSDGHHAACPLGPHLDPFPGGSPADPEAVREYLTTPVVPWPAGLRTRHHPRTTGHTAESDPPLPVWVRRTDNLSHAAANGGQNGPTAPAAALRSVCDTQSPSARVAA
jgi:hypothetical protein